MKGFGKTLYCLGFTKGQEDCPGVTSVTQIWVAAKEIILCFWMIWSTVIRICLCLSPPLPGHKNHIGIWIDVWIETDSGSVFCQLGEWLLFNRDKWWFSLSDICFGKGQVKAVMGAYAYIYVYLTKWASYFIIRNIIRTRLFRCSG